MFRRGYVWLICLIYLSSCSSSKLRRSLIRRQVDPQYCHAIEGFDCKCSYYRVTCTNDRDLSSPLNIVENEKGKYQSVEIVITAPRDIHVNDQTFEPIKQLYKANGDNLEFRVKFEKFTALHLSSAGIFNRVFPENSNNARKHMALEIYNPDVPPEDNKRLFENLNLDSLELYALYPFHGTFQELFNGANIKYLRLSGGDIKSDYSQSFTGNVARLELAKQASSLSVQNFPVYPAHEMIINAFYISDFTNDDVPNYQNLGELRVHTTERIPANAFRQFSNLHTLSVTTEKDIDSQAFNGLNQLEKLIIKDTKLSVDLLNNVPQIKEFETNVEKLDERSQCQLLEKLSNGQLAVQAIPNGRECTCVAAYLDTAAGRQACDAQGCESSSCSTIKTNYDSTTRTFRTPPTIRRADGSDALRQREAKVYSSPYQVSYQDQQKLQKAFPHSHDQHDSSQSHSQQQQQQAQQDNRYNDYNNVHDHQRGEYSSDHGRQPSMDEYPYPNHHDHSDQHHHEPSADRTEISNDYGDGDETPSKDSNDAHQSDQKSNVDHRYSSDYDQGDQGDQGNGNPSSDQSKTSETSIVQGKDEDEQSQSPYRSDYDDINDQKKDQDHTDHSHHQHNQNNPNEGNVAGGIPTDDDDDDEKQDGTKSDGQDDQGNANTDENNPNPNPNDGNVLPNGGQSGTDEENSARTDGTNDGNPDETTIAGNDPSAPAKKGMSWLPIIIIVAAIVGLLLIGAIFLILRRKRSSGGNAGGAAASNTKGYTPTATSEQQAARA